MAMVKQDIKQAIEACRPGSEDVSLPEMSQLADAIRDEAKVREQYERIQRSDTLIRDAFRDVVVPDGLADRLLESLADAQPRESIEQRPSPRSVRREVVGLDDGGLRLQKTRRRRWFRTALCLAAISTVFLMAVVYVNRPRNEPIPSEQLRAEVSAWRAQVVRNGWQRDMDSVVARNRPLDVGIAATPRQWCQIETRYDATTVVYDLANSSADFACVYCMHIRTSNSDLPATPPLTPYRPTGRISMGVWRHGDMVYVLAVQGDAARYGEFLDATILFGFLTASSPSLS
jgi:hypothetical protein